MDAPIGGEPVALYEAEISALKDSVDGALAVQTRLKTHLEAVQLVVDDSGVRLSSNGGVDRWKARHDSNEREAIADLADLVHYADALRGQGVLAGPDEGTGSADRIDDRCCASELLGRAVSERAWVGCRHACRLTLCYSGRR